MGSAQRFVSHSATHPGGYPESSIMGAQGQAETYPLPFGTAYLSFLLPFSWK
jgi:hypothetical protein